MGATITNNLKRPEPQALAITIGVLTDKALQLLRYDRDDDSTSTVTASILQLVDRLAEAEAEAQRAG